MEKLKEIGKAVHGIIKEDKTLSRIAQASGLPYGDLVSGVVSSLGYGRKRKSYHPQMVELASKLHGMGVPMKARNPKKKGRGPPGSTSAPNPYTVAAEQAVLAEALGDRLNALERAAPLGPYSGMLTSASAAPSRSPSVTSTESTRGRKAGKGFFDFVGKAIQAPLAGVAALSGGLHGAIGSFGAPKKRGGRKMLAITPVIYE
jgi:hypothetical protein